MGSMTSHTWPMASPPDAQIACTTASGGSMSHTLTRAPSAAKALASVAPIPCAAPVTIAEVPSVVPCVPPKSGDTPPIAIYGPTLDEGHRRVAAGGIARDADAVDAATDD